LAGLIDQAFGAEGEWEQSEPCGFGEVARDGWAELRESAISLLGANELPNLLAVDREARCVFLPTHVQSMSLTLSCGAGLRCASLHGLRRELSELAERLGLPLDDDRLAAILQSDESAVVDPPDVVAFARLALAANEAVRRDCPLWLVGSPSAE
jgi:hypothetical protein